jgi:hypothetical protein
MKNDTFDINALRVAQPCPMSWNDMAGDHRTRFCGSCQHRVHNVSGMSRSEVEQMLTGDGRICVRLYRRADGTVMTRDCPTGLKTRRRRIAGVAGSAFAALLGLFTVGFGQKDDTESQVTTGNAVRIVKTQAEAGMSSVSGSLQDENGAVIPGGMVFLYHDDKELLKTTSDDEGHFSFERVAPGTYEIRVPAKGGFLEAKVENIKLTSDQKIELTLILTAGGETVGMLELLPSTGINLTTTEQTTVFTRDMIDRIPGRKPFD